MKQAALFLAAVLMLLLVACGGGERDTSDTPTVEATSVSQNDETESSSSVGPGSGMGRGMGPGSGMMDRHRATVPETYAGLSNPLEATEEVLEAGAETYTTYCATCHGDGGMGDGPARTGLDPAPSPIAHTSQMLGDDYLFWRVSEGGAMAPFNSAMPAWKGPLTEGERWQVIGYVRALGSGDVTPGQMMGGAMYDPEAEAVARAEMLAEAVDSGVLAQGEADVFADVHAEMDQLMADGMPRAAGGMSTMQQALIRQLVNNGSITEEQAEIFNDVHERLLDAGLMQ